MRRLVAEKTLSISQSGKIQILWRNSFDRERKSAISEEIQHRNQPGDFPDVVLRRFPRIVHLLWGAILVTIERSLFLAQRGP
jgi:hypothetical protein